ncbi:vacuolar assembly/sorting protein VPS16 [Moesziomyces antarcticus T-34]|uniref:Vacuolar assembly/sorting protein VPS16 n=1 Tax=Pseudozyma antarctica (strain T-34) TaxID=1151754 RepID=M9MA86_PSEA3|nr:vacuolar assembly/sorting protein VPS16 [Moesziomyces antarcticus T-34]
MSCFPPSFPIRSTINAPFVARPYPSGISSSSYLPLPSLSRVSLTFDPMSSLDAVQAHSNMQLLHEYMGFASPISLSRRSRIQRACIACRRRKIKCNGNLDGCAHCAEKDQKCFYEPVPADEKLKARSYKRQLIQRRQQTRVYYDRSHLPDPRMFAAAYGMPPAFMHGVAPYPTGFYTSQPALPSPNQMHVAMIASPIIPPLTSSPMEQDVNSYFTIVASPESSAQLQSITGTSSFTQPNPSPLLVEPLSTPALSSSLSSPTLSVIDPCASGQTHFHDFVGGLELYNVPCMANTFAANVPALPMEDLVMVDTTAPSAASSTYSSTEQFSPPLPANFGYISSQESVATVSALAGAFS